MSEHFYVLFITLGTKCQQRRPVHTCNRTLWTARCYFTGLFGAMSVFVRRIKETLQLRPEQVWTVRRAETRNTTAPVSCSLSSSLCCNRTFTHKPPHIHTQTTAHPHTTHRTSTHKPLTHNFSWAPDGLQSDIDTDRVMVNIDTNFW
jgi:hypothetical protein